MKWMVEIHTGTHDVFNRVFTEQGTAERCYDRNNADGEIITDVRLWTSMIGRGQWQLVEKKGNN